MSQPHTHPSTRQPGSVMTAGAVAGVGALTLPVAAAWHLLATTGITVAPPPQRPTGATIDEGMQIYFRWLATTVPQEQWYITLAMIGFGFLGAVAVASSRGGRRLTHAGGLTVAIGCALWIVSSLGRLGGHQAVGLMATHANPIDTVNAIAFTVDTTADDFALAAFVCVGVGLLALTGAPPGGRKMWPLVTWFTAAAALGTAWTYAAGSDGITDALLTVNGLLLSLWCLGTLNRMSRR